VKQDVKEWLPKGAFCDGAIKAALADTVAHWSGDWFSHPAAISAVCFAGRNLPHQDSAQGLHVRGVCADARLSGRGKRILLEQALAVDLSGQVLCESDHQVLAAFAAQVVEDLTARLDALFEGEAPPTDAPRIGLTVSIAGSEMLSLALPDFVLVPLLKSKIRAARTLDDAPRGRMEALKSQRLGTEGILGNAELNLNDLGMLDVGDVLILDRRLNDSVELRISGGGQLIGRGKLGRNGNRVSIQL
jgi:flagellar motor switch/type III secretory pathway protein FliN